ncbi:dispanin subfamily A member 2b-like [Podarcis raffonei]|uniref:dispanin subfamily A member 2b-like n=1 Tax=Podarcis raffonei TaxID=65483 RepID=UPI0023296C34|nr:dispanin subfamily A member 2b-like [Podarcis raffonei]
MASGAHFPLPGQASGGLPRYEELKDEHDMAILDPAGASPGSTVIHMHNQSQVCVAPPRDHILWSICTMMYCNFCCLGFMALVFSVKARDRKVVGDHSGARSYGSTAQCLNITAVTLCIVPIVIVIILLATGFFTPQFLNGY